METLGTKSLITLLAAVAAGALAGPSVATASNGLATGDFHSCAVTGSGSVRCWGSNVNGQIGDGSRLDRVGPVTVSGIKNAVSITAGGRHSCALLADRSVRCWGSNASGQLGDGTTEDRSVPVSVRGITTATAVSAGSEHTCAVLAEGTALCWGSNGTGRLGDGTADDSTVPVAVSGMTAAAGITAGGSHTCALLSTGRVQCWGYNYYGELGDGGTARSWTPVDVAGIEDAVGIGAGSYHSCALLAGGRISCWGNNVNGALGDGTNIRSRTPIEVAGLGRATGFAVGAYHTCALLTGGSARCWGGNSSGQLGDGTFSRELPFGRLRPVIVAGVTSATGVAAGGEHSCAQLIGGGNTCWGANQVGQLGDGTRAASAVAVPVSDLDVDSTPPELLASAASSRKRAASWTSYRLVTRRDASGLARVEYSTSTGRPRADAPVRAGRVVAWAVPLVIRTRSTVRWIRLQDGTGNWSRWFLG